MPQLTAAKKELERVFAALLGFYVVTYLLSALTGLLPAALPPETDCLIREILPYAAGMTTALLILDKDREGWQFGRLTTHSATLSVMTALAFIMPIQLLSAGFDSFLRSLGVISYAPEQTLVLQPMALVLEAVKMVVLPVFFEELIFRGLIFSRLQPYGDRFAIFASSILFALMHNSLYSLPGTFLFGIIMCTANLAAGSLLPSMVIHGVNNGAAFLGMLAAATGNAEYMLQFERVFGYLSMLSAIALPVTLIMERLKRGKLSPIKPGGLSPAAVFRSAPAVLMMIFMLVQTLLVSEIRL